MLLYHVVWPSYKLKDSIYIYFLRKQDKECYMLGKCWTGAYCRYFRSAVLPLDPVLERSLTVEHITETRPCPVCGRAFLPDGRQRYCSPTCARAARRQKQRGYMRKYRGRPWAFSPGKIRWLQGFLGPLHGRGVWFHSPARFCRNIANILEPSWNSYCLWHWN